MQVLKIHKVGDSLGVTLSPEILHKLQVGEGDSILAIETAEGIQIVTSGSEFESGMAAYTKIVDKYGIALQELAK